MGLYTMEASDRNTPRRQRSACAVLMGLLTVWIVLTFALRASAQPEAALRSEVVTIWGTVRNSEGKPIGEALVHLERKGVTGTAETKTDAAGGFTFSHLGIGSYQLSAEKSGLRSHSGMVVATAHGDRERVDLILEASEPTDMGAQPSTASGQTMEFSDKPNFSVAGVTDWTAVGGHGSDSTLRTSEALASETSKLKAEVSGGNAGSGAGAGHRVAGELAEQRGDPLVAVHEFEQAVQLDPSEENYFEWGSELLLHRAVWQAEQTLHRGADLYPKSARMLTGLGAALFAGARYD